MSMFPTLQAWSEKHNSVWLDMLRFVLGFIIFMKGYYFIRDTASLEIILENSRFEFMSFMLAHYVAMTHLAGGFLIMIGLVTRLAVLFQIPILIGAIFFINSTRGFFTVNSELEISITILAMLIFFFIYGSGKFFSFDSFLRKYGTN